MSTSTGNTSPAPYKLALRGGARRSVSKGVYFDSSTRGRARGARHAEWRAEVYCAGRRIRLGRFMTEAEAAQAYNAACIRLGKPLGKPPVVRTHA